MHYKQRKAALAFILCFILSFGLIINTAYAGSQQERISGQDRYKTSAAISQSGWPEGSDYAIIARGDDFADALSAGPLAKMLKGPILLTEPGKLSGAILEELKRLNVKHVIIIGGNGAVSGNVEGVLKSNGFSDIQRISGSDRYETSALIAERIGTSSSVVLATGDDYPDALSISAIASRLGMPILLTQKGNLPEKIKKYMDDKKVNKTYIIGGSGVIGDSVGNNVPGPVRLGGKDRYETNILVMQQFEKELDFSNIYIAVGDGPSGNEFADALSGAVLASMTSSPVILVYKTMPDATGNYIKEKASSNKVIALGGEGAVPTAVVDKLISYISGTAVTPPVTPPAAGGAPAGGGGGGGAPVAAAPSLSAEVVIYPSMTSPASAVSNGGTIDITSLGDGTQVYGFNVTVDRDSQLVITDINNMNLSWLLKTNSTTLSAGTKTLVKIDDILDGTKGDNGVSLKTFRANSVTTATFNGKLMKDGKQIGTVTVTLKL